jgi:hypothetical protein
MIQKNLSRVLDQQGGGSFHPRDVKVCQFYLHRCDHIYQWQNCEYEQELKEFKATAENGLGSWQVDYCKGALVTYWRHIKTYRFLPLPLTTLSWKMPAASTKMSTRASNALKHPGVPDQTKKKRSPAEIATLRVANDAKAAMDLASPFIVADVSHQFWSVFYIGEAVPFLRWGHTVSRFSSMFDIRPCPLQSFRATWRTPECVCVNSSILQ